MTIANCEFEDYIDIVLSELIQLKLSNNTYKGEVRHAIHGEKYIDSDKFLLRSIPFPKDHYYIKTK